MFCNVAFHFKDILLSLVVVIGSAYNYMEAVVNCGHEIFVNSEVVLKSYLFIFTSWTCRQFILQSTI